jgi:hypothetical protein
MTKNKLKILIQKICVDRNDTTLSQRIIEQLVNECEVSRFSVLRWLRNDSQPASTKFNAILSVLSQYDNTVTISDFFVTQNVTSGVTRSVKVPKHKQLVK